MAEADLVAVIRQTAKAQGKAVMDAAKKRHGQLMAKAASTKDKEARARLKLLPSLHWCVRWHGATPSTAPGYTLPVSRPAAP